MTVYATTIGMKKETVDRIINFCQKDTLNEGISFKHEDDYIVIEGEMKPQTIFSLGKTIGHLTSYYHYEQKS